MEETKKTKSEIKGRKTLAELFNDPCAVEIRSTQMHQAFMLPGKVTESSLNSGRAGQKDLKMVYHPGYGLIGILNGKYFLSPNANMIVGNE